MRLMTIEELQKWHIVGTYLSALDRGMVRILVMCLFKRAKDQSKMLIYSRTTLCIYLSSINRIIRINAKSIPPNQEEGFLNKINKVIHLIISKRKAINPQELITFSKHQSNWKDNNWKKQLLDKRGRRKSRRKDRKKAWQKQEKQE
jgi:hypothetical protein